MSIKLPSDSIDPGFTILQDLFNVPRRAVVMDTEETKLSEEFSPEPSDNAITDTSNFSFKDVGVGDYLTTIQEKRESVVSLVGVSTESFVVGQNLPDENKKRSVAYIVPEQAEVNFHIIFKRDTR